MTDVERPAKVRKTKRSDTVSKPDVVIEMAEPVTTKKEDDDGARNRTRQLTVEDVPYAFLTPQQKEEVDREQEENRRQREEFYKRDKEEARKMKVLLGLALGAGLGMFAAYLVKRNLFTDAVEAAVETVNKIVDEN